MCGQRLFHLRELVGLERLERVKRIDAGADIQVKNIASALPFTVQTAYLRAAQSADCQMRACQFDREHVFLFFQRKHICLALLVAQIQLILPVSRHVDQNLKRTRQIFALITDPCILRVLHLHLPILHCDHCIPPFLNDRLLHDMHIPPAFPPGVCHIDMSISFFAAFL